MAVNGSLSVKVNASESGTNDFGTPGWAGILEHSLNFTNGTGANQMNLVFFDERTVASATNDDLDLNAVLTSALGTSIAALELVMIAIVNKPKSGTANTTNLTVGAGTNPVAAFTTALPAIRPGGFLIMGNPDASGIGAIVAATGDILRVANSSGASAIYQVALFARNA